MNYNNDSHIINKIKSLDIIYLKISTCPYCIKMDSVLLSKNLLNYMHVIDVQTNDGKKIAQENKLTGFPSFISKRTGKKISGYTNDINKLINDLE
jgi:glutaredoxin